MFEYINKIAEENNCSFISLIADSNNKKAQLFYEKLGYTREVGYVKVINKI